MKRAPSNKAKEILKFRKDSLNKNDFLPVLMDALEEDVCDEMLDIFFESGISVPSEQLTSTLREYYVKKRIDISGEERAQKELRAQYLINKNQIAVFKTLSAISLECYREYMEFSEIKEKHGEDCNIQKNMI